MKFIQKNKMELCDTPVADLFILNNMFSLEAVDIKLYLYMLFLSKSGTEIDKPNLAKKLCVSEQEINFALDRLQAEELIIKSSQGFLITDLKENEVNKTYIPKLEPKINRVQSELERKRIAAAEAINESFFQGIMSLGWYTDIGTLFKNYNFSEEVMIALFHYCQERNALNKKYVYAVAENWYNGGVKTFEQLEEFLESYECLQKIKQKIVKALRLNRNITKYEEQYINTWVKDYNYDFAMIEEALKRTVTIANPTISYINGILSNWHKKGFKTVKDLDNDNKTTEEKSKQYNKNTLKEKSKYQSYEQRSYTDLESFYDNM